MNDGIGSVSRHGLRDTLRIGDVARDLDKPAIGRAASLLPLRRAILKYKPDEKVCTLPNYLKHFTTLWARRLAKKGELGKPFPQVDLSVALAEAYGGRIYESVVKAGPLPKPPWRQANK